MNLFLHIGRPKTASSTIQQCIVDNKAELIQAGIQVPDFLGNGNHRLLATIVKARNGELDDTLLRRGFEDLRDASLFLKRTENKLDAWLKNVGSNQNVVITCEQLSSFDSEKIYLLKKLLYKYAKKVTVIVYIRRQDEALLSRYNTAVLSGLSSFYSQNFNFPKEKRKNLDHYKMIDRWASQFEWENVLVKVLDKKKLVHGSVSYDFLSSIGVGDLSNFVAVKNQNASLAGATLEAVRILNHRLSESGLAKTDIVRVSRIIHKAAKVSSYAGEKYLPSRAEARRFYSLYEDSNRLLANKLGVSDELFECNFDKYPLEAVDVKKSETFDAMLELTYSVLHTLIEEQK